jgi:multidrug transporter EmrE-like cation transporter
MSPVALALVLVAAFLHAVWNLLAKRAGGGAAFTWLFGVWSALIYAPAGLYLVVRDEIALGPLEVGFVLGSAVIHVAYFLTLQRGYRAGAMSVVYPLARGTGPMLALVGAVLLFGERPSAAARSSASPPTCPPPRCRAHLDPHRRRRRRSVHGIYGNVIWDGERFRYANPDDVRVPTLPRPRARMPASTSPCSATAWSGRRTPRPSTTPGGRTRCCSAPATRRRSRPTRGGCAPRATRRERTHRGAGRRRPARRRAGRVRRRPLHYLMSEVAGDQTMLQWTPRWLANRARRPT